MGSIPVDAECTLLVKEVSSEVEIPSTVVGHSAQQHTCSLLSQGNIPCAFMSDCKTELMNS